MRYRGCGIAAPCSPARTARLDRRTAPNLPKVRSRAVSEESDVWVFSLSCRCVRPAWPSPAVRLSPALRFVRGVKRSCPTGSGSGCRIFPTPFGEPHGPSILRSITGTVSISPARISLLRRPSRHSWISLDCCPVSPRRTVHSVRFSGARLVPTGCTV